ncbi:50S ribosomal protein L23 [bacterium]|jgi:large subunit ribosomal protein L23|nr:50S ribosomal protein L23 [bacterium]
MARKASKSAEVRKFPLPTEHDYAVLKTPLVTEKSMKLMQDGQRIVLKVAVGATAPEIKKAFESIFNRKVKRINTANVRSKPKKMGKFEGTVPAYKKAIIILAEGESLDLFAEEK